MYRHVCLKMRQILYKAVGEKPPIGLADFCILPSKTGVSLLARMNETMTMAGVPDAKAWFPKQGLFSPEKR